MVVHIGETFFRSCERELKKIGKGYAGTYRYGFNGKEGDSGGEWGGQNNYDYGFRIYNPSIAKFLSVDPLASSYPSWSPYPFAMNSPISGIDLDGLEFYYASDGALIGKFGTSTELRLVNNNEVSSAKMAFGNQGSVDDGYFHFYLKSQGSREMKVNVNGQDIQKMWNNSNPYNSKTKVEKSAYIILDSKNAEIRLHHNNSEGNTRDKSHNDSAFPGKNDDPNRYLDKQRTELILGQVHTHPNTSEEGYPQEPHIGDQNVAKMLNASMYTIGHGDVDKLTPNSMVNDYTTSNEVIENKVNLAIDALKTKSGEIK
ncbi:RHS repeat domain-containing protein [Cyclobacterium plantarum]|uniref:RHS repeat domain-containing protein n=1 Tax=Cyclobacterium plantarum TaxID=2716263 RepID=UPI003F6F8177